MAEWKKVVVSGSSAELSNLNVDSAVTASFFKGDGSALTNISAGSIDHDSLSGFVANEHIDHTSVEVTAGAGLTGGGDISATRTLTVGAGDGITVNADDIAVDGTVLRTTGDSVISSSAQVVLEDADKTGFTGASSITTVGTVTTGKLSIGGSFTGASESDSACSSIAGGRSQLINAKCAFIGGGHDNLIRGGASGLGSGILAGKNNLISSGSYSTVIGGYGNKMNENANCGVVANCSAVVGGQENCIVGSNHSAIIGGSSNKVSGSLRSVVLGGNANDTATFDDVFILGTGITATQDNTVFMNSASIAGTVTANKFSGDGSGITNLSVSNLSGNISESAQVVLQDADKTGFTGASSITTLGTVTAGNVTAILPSGIVSSSAQLADDFIDTLGDGVISSSAQIVLEDADKTGFTGASSITTVGTLASGQIAIGGTASGTRAAVLTGQSNTAAATDSVVITGNTNNISAGACSLIGAGMQNKIHAGLGYSAIVTGNQNIITGSNSFGGAIIGGGSSNRITNTGEGGILAGQSNILNNAFGSTIAGGSQNVIGCSSHGSIVGGSENTITSGSLGGIFGGYRNNIVGGYVGGSSVGLYNSTLSGYENTITFGKLSSIIGGCYNEISGSERSVILGGQHNHTAHFDDVFILGTGISASQDNTVFMNSASIAGTATANKFVGDGSGITNLSVSNLSGNISESAQVDGTAITNNSLTVTAGDGLSGGGSVNLGGTVSVAVQVDDSSLEINSDTVRVKASGVTNDMLAGSIANSKLANDGITIAGNDTSLGDSITAATILAGTGVLSGSANADTATSASFATNAASADAVANDSVVLGTSTTGDYVASLGSGTGVTIAANSGEGSNPTISVDYGSASDEAVRGNTTATFTGTANEITVSDSSAQALGAGISVQIGLPDDVTIAGNLTAATGSVNGDLSVSGNLSVGGDLTYINSTDLVVEDPFILLNSGSNGATQGDSGIIFGGADDVVNSGNLLFWDKSYNGGDGRLSIKNGFAHNTTGNPTPDYSIAGVFEGSAADAQTAEADHVGNIRVESDEIYIYV